MKTRITALLILTCILLSVLCGCGNNSNNDISANDTAQTVTTGEIGVIEDDEYGGVFIDLSIDEFNALGFAFGDSLDISFDNGTTLEDIPYYSGYFCPIDALLAIGYPGSPHVKIARSYGDSTWEEFQLTDSSKVTVTLNEKAKYLGTQELNELEYSYSREDYDSDAEYANFREVKGGTLREKGFYRSSSPCDNQINRASYANNLTKENGVKFVINLADDEDNYLLNTLANGFDWAYYDGIYHDGNVLFLCLDANYRSDAFAKSVSDAFLEMTNHDGPCLIHCVEGKDRTGFVCTVLLALADASADQITDDYMETYKNFYGVTKESDPEKYDAILQNVDGFMYCICDAEEGTPIDTLDLKSGAENYLRKGGLNDDQIAKIEAYIK